MARHSLPPPVLRFFWEGRTLPGWHEPRRRLYDCELVYLSEGVGTVIFDTTPHSVKAGALIIVPPATWHESLANAGQAMVRHCVHFDWDFGDLQRKTLRQNFAGRPFDKTRVAPVPPAFRNNLPLVTRVQEHPGLEAILDLLLTEIRAGRETSEYFLGGVMQTLMPGRTTHRENKPVQGRRLQALSALKLFIEDHYADAIDYSDFQKITGISSSRLCQAFRQWMGYSPTAYLNNLRLQHARRLLAETPLRAKEVAQRVGIPDASYFSRRFRQRFGMAPRDVSEAQ